MPGVRVVDGGGDGGPQDRVHGGGRQVGPGICGVVVQVSVQVSVQAVTPHLGHCKYQWVRGFYSQRCSNGSVSETHQGISPQLGWKFGKTEVAPLWLGVSKLSEDKVLTVIA